MQPSFVGGSSRGKIELMQRRQAFKYELMPTGEAAPDAPLRRVVPVRLRSLTAIWCYRRVTTVRTVFSSVWRDRSGYRTLGDKACNGSINSVTGLMPDLFAKLSVNKSQVVHDVDDVLVFTRETMNES